MRSSCHFIRRALRRLFAGACLGISAVLVGSAAGAVRPPPPALPSPELPLPGLTDPVAFVDSLLGGTGMLPDPEALEPRPPRTAALERQAEPRRPPSSSFVFPPLTVAGGPPQGALVGLAPGSFASFGTGTVYHADAALSGQDPDSDQSRFTDIELGFSGAVFSSAALPARTNELRRPLSPALAAANGYGVGNAAEVGFNNRPSQGGQLELDDRSEVKAPPGRDPVSKNLTEVDLGPVTRADVLRSGAAARAAGTGCVVGADLAFGEAEFTDTALVRQAEADAAVVSTTANRPPRGVSRSVSRTHLTTLPGRPVGLFGLVSETRQTIAPLTILEGTDQQLTIELAGEWVLRAFSDGVKGTVTFGPEMDDADTPLLRVLDAEGEPVNEITMEALVTKDGSAFDIAEGVRITLGEDPRAIGGDELSQPLTAGTLTAGAVDVVRLQLADPENGKVSELRVGHMEAGVALPAGGVRCPDIGMVKESSPGQVQPGEVFTWSIRISNLNDCVLDDLKVVDTITAPAGIGYEVLSTSPPAQREGSTLTFKDVGPIPFGASRTLSIRVRVSDTAAPGRFRDEAVASGVCGPATVGGEAATETAVKAVMQGRVSLEAPDVTAIRTSSAVAVAGPREVLARPAERALPRTGGDLLAVLPALALLTAGRVLRGRPRRRR